MKSKAFIVIIIVAILVLMQVIFGRRSQPAVPTAAPASVESADPVASVESVEFVRPAPADIAAVSMGEGDLAVTLAKAVDGWVVKNLHDLPADDEKVEQLLHDLLVVYVEPLPADAANSARTGLENDGGYPVVMTTLAGDEYRVAVGLRPRGEYDRTYARFPNGVEAMLSSDVRGDLGLWKNRGDIAIEPDPMMWMDRVVLRFNPEDATGILATYPDHQIRLSRDDDYIWHVQGYAPTEQWDRPGLTAWLNDLSAFNVAAVILPEDVPAYEGEPSHTLEIQLGDAVKRLRVYPNHTGGEGMLVESDDFPGRVFHLPEWRFRRYFRRLPSLFPGAVPAFEVADIRFLDIRRGGETVKISRRDGEWYAVALNYPLRAGAMDRLARMLAGWHPEDYAAPDFLAIRPNYGGPMVEVILANGDVHQYRLAGRHPLFPWRYVILDGKAVYSITEPEAGVMFPDFADVMDLGRVFGGLAMSEVEEIVLSGGDRSQPLLILRRGEGEAWVAESGGHTVPLEHGKGWSIVNDMLNWQVKGFFDIGSASIKHAPTYHLRVVGRDGGVRGIAVLQPEDRDVPFVEDGGRAFLLSRDAFSNWQAEANRLMEEMENQAAAEARAQAEAAPEPEPEAIVDRKAADGETKASAEEAIGEAEDMFAVPDVLLAEPSEPEPPVEMLEEPAAENPEGNNEAPADDILPEADPDPEAVEIVEEEVIVVDDPFEIVARTIEEIEADRVLDGEIPEAGAEPAPAPEEQEVLLFSE